MKGWQRREVTTALTAKDGGPWIERRQRGKEMGGIFRMPGDKTVPFGILETQGRRKEIGFCQIRRTDIGRDNREEERDGNRQKYLNPLGLSFHLKSTLVLCD